MKYLALILFLSVPSFAQEWHYLNWGIAQDYPGGGTYSDVQTYSLGVQDRLNNTFDLFGEFGGWKDQGHYEGALPGVFVAVGISLDLRMHEHYAQYSLGPSFIGPTDTLLGSPFEVYHKLSVGFQEQRTNKRIGLFIKHFSDAGLSKVNYGRNFAGIEVGF